MNNRRAWVTLATNDTYSLGALVLAHSLKKVNTQHDLVILITTNVTGPMRGALQAVFHEVKEVNILDSGDAENLRLLARPELGITFTKLHCWRLTQYDKCVFLDADTLVLQNCDDLFEREELSAAPDVGWPDCFNSGVFVFKPSEETYKSIIDFAMANGSFDGGDQGLLNMYFSNWATADSSKRLPFLYNLSSAAIYSYLPAFKWYGKGVKIVHFIGNSKPWQQSFNSVSRSVSTVAECAHLTNFYQYWWNLFCATVHPQLSPDMTGVAQSLSQMTLEEPTPEQLAEEDSARRKDWEQGNIDYLGRDSFDNIWSKISQSISADTEAAPSQQPEDSLTPVSSSQLPEGQPAPVTQSAAPLEPASAAAPATAPVFEPVPAQTCSLATTVDSTAAIVSPPAVAADAPAASAAPPETAVAPAEVTSVAEAVAAPTQTVITPELAATSAESVEVCPKATPTEVSAETAEAPVAESPIAAPSSESPAKSDEAPAQSAEKE